MTPHLRTALGLSGFVVGYVLLAYAGLLWAAGYAAASSVWPAAGLAVGAGLLAGPRIWPAVFVASLIATSLDPTPFPLSVRLVMAAGNSAALVAAVWAMRRLGVDPAMRRPEDVLGVFLIGGVGAGALAGSIAMLGLRALQGMGAAEAWSGLGRWIFGDLVGVAMIAPAVLTWARPDPLRRDWGWWFWFVVLLGAVGVLAWGAYVDTADPGGIYPVHLVPVLILVAFALDARATATVNLLTACIALYGALTGVGPAANVEFFGEQQFVTITAFTLVLVAVMVEGLRGARDAVANQQHYRLTAENEERLRMSQEAGQVGSWDLDVRAGRAVVSPTHRRMFGWPDDRTEFSVEEWAERVHPEDRERAAGELRACLETGAPYSTEYRIVLPSGEIRHVEGRARAVLGEDGRPVRALGVVVDVTERKQTEERQRLLMREIDHRAKNALAVVQAAVRLSQAETREEFAAAVEGRVQAIARVHNLLAASRWTGASLGKLIEGEIALHQRGDGGGARVRAEGPEIVLEPDAAQPFALVLHELFANAVRHGALSVPEGTVTITWRADPAANRLGLVWREHGGPRVSEPTRKGFGSTLIAASVERQLDGKLRRTWARDGLKVELDVPLFRAVRVDRERAWTAEADGRAAMLLVEDEALIGLDMKARLEAMGWRVVGPIGNTDDALRAAEAIRPAAAVLDVNLAGQSSEPVARRLREIGVPFAFATGYGDYALGAAEFDAPVLVKPATTGELRQALADLGVAPSTTH